MANTIADTVYREKWKTATLQEILRTALVAEKICEVDRGDNKTIKNPYGSEAVTQITAIVGTYNIDDYSTTDDTLTVDNMFKNAEHVYDFEEVLSHYDLFANRVEQQAFNTAASIDQFVLCNLLTDATGSYTTPSGGFTTASNLNVIMSNLISKVSGYRDAYKGLYLVLENTDITGVIQAQATNGYSFADAALNNGFMSSYMGVDIYVVRSGTFVTSTLGTKSVVASGRRVFGVKGVSTYAAPRGIRFEEKSVTGKTGKEIVTWGYIGFKLWAQKAELTVDILLTA